MKKSLTLFRQLHLETLNELTGVNRRMEAENRSLVEKSLMEEINNMKNPQVVYHLSVIQAKMQGLKNKEQMLKQKYEK